MDVLVGSEVGDQLSAWMPSLVVLVVTAAVAFGIGMFLRYRRAKIQREYQERVDELKRKQKTGPEWPGSNPGT